MDEADYSMLDDHLSQIADAISDFLANGIGVGLLDDVDDYIHRIADNTDEINMTLGRIADALEKIASK